mgnify:CR=1 FL=1
MYDALGSPIGANDQRFPPPIEKALKSASTLDVPFLASALKTPKLALIKNEFTVFSLKS